MVGVVSVGGLDLHGEFDPLLVVDVELLSEIELLEHVLKHEVETVLLCLVVEVEAVEVVTVYLLVIFNHVFIDGVLHLEQLNLRFKVAALLCSRPDAILAESPDVFILMSLLYQYRAHPVINNA